MFRKIVTYVLIVTMSAPGWAGTVVNPGPVKNTGKPGKTCTPGESQEMSTEDMIARINKVTDSIEEVRSYIDRSQFDLDALVEKLDYDADKIINFVKDEIYFEQYPGLLRGARGALMSSAGNALDQSVLLATLLGNAGFEARIATGDTGRIICLQAP